MWIVAIAWMYVTVMMSVAEATATNGSLLGACITFIFYGILPLALVMYILGTPARRRARKAAEQARDQMDAPERLNEGSPQPDTSGLPASHAIPAEGKEP